MNIGDPVNGATVANGVPIGGHHITQSGPHGVAIMPRLYSQHLAIFFMPHGLMKYVTQVYSLSSTDLYRIGTGVGADVAVEISTGVNVGGTDVLVIVTGGSYGVAVYPMVGCIGVWITLVGVALGTIVAVTRVGQ